MFKFNVVSILHSFQHSFIYYDFCHCHTLNLTRRESFTVATTHQPSALYGKIWMYFFAENSKPYKARGWTQYFLEFLVSVQEGVRKKFHRSKNFW